MKLRDFRYVKGIKEEAIFEPGDPDLKEPNILKNRLLEEQTVKYHLNWILDAVRRGDSKAKSAIRLIKAEIEKI